MYVNQTTGENVMCELCDNSSEGRAAAKEALHNKADRLRQLAKNYERLANGEIKPHTPAANLIGLSARQIIRELVEEWV
jgi:hypothetical protein